MEQRTIGRSGLQVSVLGLGCNNFGKRLDERASRQVVSASLDAGISFFDTADCYGQGASERILGAALRGVRDEVVVATKFSSPMGDGPYRSGASRKYVMMACEASLRRLGTDYIDLYYQHWPDPATPVTETLDVLDDLVRAGKVRYVACSNFAGWQVARAAHVAAERGRSRFVACQAEWSLLRRQVEAELVPACAAYEVGVVPYFPLASGLLTGKYARGEPFPEGTRLASSPQFAREATEEAFDAIDRLVAAAASIGRTLLEVAVGWLLHRPEVPSVLTGATTPDQVRANAAAAGVALPADEQRAIAEASARPPAGTG
ncbi:MAG: aldo/keto reductase [Acidimicrobiales bacterium]